MSIATIPSVFYEFAFNADPNQNILPPWFSDLSSRALFGWSLSGWRQYESDTNEARLWKVTLANSDGALDPGNTASPYWPNILPYRSCRIRMVLGNNLLLPDQAGAGEWSPLLPGPVPALVGVTSAAGYTVAVAQVGASAYQGTQVFTAAVPAAAPSGADLLDVAVPQITAGQAYTFSVQVQTATAGITAAAVIDWIGTSGAVLSSSTGTPAAIGAAWSAYTAGGTAPAAAVAARLRLTTTATTSGAASVWTDGLQLEARGYATRWQMPWTPGVNLLPQTVGCGTETMNPVTDTAANWFYPTAGTVAQAVNLAAAPTGSTTAASWTFPTGSTPAGTALYAGTNTGTPTGPAQDCVQVSGGLSYTASAYLMRAASADATVQATAAIAWYSSAGVLLSTTTGAAVTVSTAAWTRAVVTGTAPAGAAWGRTLLRLSAPASTTAQNTVYAAAWQMEQAAAASVWADPGLTVSLFTGLVERWPRTWTELGGTYGTSDLECVDATAAMSQNPLPSPFVAEVLSYSPNFFYQLNDPANSSSCIDSASRRIAAPIESGQTGPGSLTFGNSVTSTNPPSAFTGAPGPVATFANSTNVSFVSLHKTTPVPGVPRSGPWTRLLAFRTTQATGGISDHDLWNAPGTTLTTFIITQFSSSTSIIVQYVDSAVNAFQSNTPTGINDGNWHLVAIAVNPVTGVGTAWCDGAVIGTATGLTTPAATVVDILGAGLGQGFGFGYNGDLAHAAELPVALTTAQMASLYSAWRSAASGESSSARYTRVLNWISWPGPRAIDTGSTASMGPATDLTDKTPVQALNSIAATENGDSYIGGAGAVAFTGRAALYNVRTPAAVFGEGPPVGAAGEWPCELGRIDFDPSRMANTVQVTQYQGPVYTAKSAVSAQRFFGRVYQRTINTTSGPEAQDAANYLLSQYKDPHQRADAIRLHPSAIPGLFPVVARLDKNSRIRMVKRPVGAPPTTIDGFTQRISWSWSPDNDVYVEIQASPADLANYWKLAALHTTLGAQAAAGQNHATINALPDAAYNKLAQSLPSGYSLTFEPGTARAETVALAPGGIPATSLGYATAVLTMNTNLAFTHPAGSVVCEPLPTGYTDPTAWDASSVLGAAWTPILSGGAAGTSTVTVGPLPDSATNALGTTWNTGDTVWLSSGTPARTEAATIQSVSTTYPGYTQATITFTANLTFTHPAGDSVSDPMPSSTINPATWTAPTTRLAY